MIVWSPALGPGAPRSICAGGATTLPVSVMVLPLSWAEAVVATSARATSGMGRKRTRFMAHSVPVPRRRHLGGSPQGFPESPRKLRPRLDLELAVGAREVHLDRLLGQEQRLGDLAVGHAA